MKPLKPGDRVAVYGFTDKHYCSGGDWATVTSISPYYPEDMNVWVRFRWDVHMKGIEKAEEHRVHIKQCRPLVKRKRWEVTGIWRLLKNGKHAFIPVIGTFCPEPGTRQTLVARKKRDET